MQKAWASCLVLLFLTFVIGCGKDVLDPLPLVTDHASIERGRALVRGLAACGFCHGERRDPSALLIGGLKQRDRYGGVPAANLTPDETGLKNWTTLDIFRALRGSINKDERRISKAVHKGYEWVSDGDMLSIVGYLASMPPVPHEVSRRRIGFIRRNTLGFFDLQREVRGYVPDIEKKYDVAYGAYLTDTVARCASCHNSEPGFFGGEDYLAGGKEIENEKGYKRAPNITQSTTVGIGTWGEDDIVRYFRSGKAPDGRAADPDFCPVRFYKVAPEEDLRFVAKYLKSLGK